MKFLLLKYISITDSVSWSASNKTPVLDQLPSYMYYILMVIGRIVFKMSMVALMVQT